MDRVRRPDRHGQDCRVGLRTVGHARTMREKRSGRPTVENQSHALPRRPGERRRRVRTSDRHVAQVRARAPHRDVHEEQGGRRGFHSINGGSGESLF